MTAPRPNDRPVISATTALFIAFVVLKITGTIAWSWWWVTSPLWLPAVSLVAIGVVALVVISVAGMLAAWLDQ